jgi:hypothetical protein
LIGGDVLFGGSEKEKYIAVGFIGKGDGGD